MMLKAVIKPPLGVIPRKIHNEHRIMELTRALKDYADFANEHYEEMKYESMIPWTKELYRLLKENSGVKWN